MKLFILCTVLSILIAQSLASPVKIEIGDENVISDSSEGWELNKYEKNSSTAEEENSIKIKPVQDNNEKDVSVESSEQELEKYAIVQEEISDSSSGEEEEEQHLGRSKRAVDFKSHNSNQLSVKDSIVKRLRRAEESDELASFQKLAPHLLLRNERSTDDTSEENSSEEKPSAKKPDAAPAETIELAAKPDTAPAESEVHQQDSRRRRNAPSAETSEENSSEEDQHSKGHVAPEQSLVAAKKLDTASADTLELAAKPDTAPAESQPNLGDSRRKRSPSTSEENSSEEDKQHKEPAKAHVVDIRRKRNLEAYNEVDVLQEHEDGNEVFIFSSEKLKDSQENFDALTNPENVILDDNNLEKGENKNSEEDYAQGCGGSSDSDDSNENSDENHETITDK